MVTSTVAVIGANGRMGAEVCRAVDAADDLVLAAMVDGNGVGTRPTGIEDGPVVQGSFEEVDWEAVDVAVEFTGPATVRANVEQLIGAGVDVVVGATGMDDDDLATLSAAAAQAGRRVFVAPNFAIGAVLMMQFAAAAARHLPTIEVIELHHDGKVDAPSGTALRTAELVANARREAPTVVGGDESHPGARGFSHLGVPIHSVRLSGLVAHQEVIAGGAGETLTIRHDSIDRLSFMPGVLLAIRNIASQTSPVVVGLEHLL